MSYATLIYEKKGQVANITFNRPEIHNAFNSTAIREMSACLTEIDKSNEFRVVILTGAGKSFCAGADMHWMKDVVEQPYEKNLSESNELSELFDQIYSFRLPFIGKINGAAVGGGTGFVAVCDIAIAVRSATFSFSEVKIGLVPACIGPYVIKKMGEGKARELFITGERMTAERACEVGLINKVVDDDQLHNAVDELVESLLSSGPNAVSNAKKLISALPLMTKEEYKPYTAKLIADLRKSEEGQEGMNAFLNKRKPKWSP